MSRDDAGPLPVCLDSARYDKRRREFEEARKDPAWNLDEEIAKAETRLEALLAQAGQKDPANDRDFFAALSDAHDDFRWRMEDRNPPAAAPVMNTPSPAPLVNTPAAAPVVTPARVSGRPCSDCGNPEAPHLFTDLFDEWLCEACHAKFEQHVKEQDHAWEQEKMLRAMKGLPPYPGKPRNMH